MISLEQKHDPWLDLARDQLIQALVQYKHKPYLPVWGELFSALREIARLGERKQENVRIYSVHPSGTLWYVFREKHYLADLPEPGITISLTQEQLIDALLQGSFAPRLPDSC